LLLSILKGTSFFDIERPYSIINFDGLLQCSLNLKGIELLKDIYDAIGIAEGYANQVLDEDLIALLTNNTLL